MHATHFVVAAGVAAVLLGGCAAPPARTGAAAAARGNACVFESSVTGFRSVDARRIIILGLGRDSAYLAEVSAGCFDLERPWALALIDGDHNGQICGFGRDSIAYRDGGRLERCRILRLDRLSPQQLEAIELEHGPRKPGPPADPAP